jgi:hypothetical protein
MTEARNILDGDVADRMNVHGDDSGRRLDSMRIGAIGAWLVFRNRRSVLNALYSRVTQLIVYALAVYLVLTPRHKPLLH